MSPTDLIPRRLQPVLTSALASHRALVLHGARQCGKTTLARQVCSASGGSYLSLDEEAVALAADEDPDSLLANMPQHRRGAARR